VCFFAGGVDRADINQLFRGGVRKTSPRKTEQAKHDQDDPKRFVHAASFGGGSYLQPPLTKGEQSGTQIPGEMHSCNGSSEIDPSALLMLLQKGG
jgi:hypothetical protein